MIQSVKKIIMDGGKVSEKMPSSSTIGQYLDMLWSSISKELVDKKITSKDQFVNRMKLSYYVSTGKPNFISTVNDNQFRKIELSESFLTFMDKATYNLILLPGEKRCISFLSTLLTTQRDRLTTISKEVGSDIRQISASMLEPPCDDHPKTYEIHYPNGSVVSIDVSESGTDQGMYMTIEVNNSEQPSNR